MKGLILAIMLALCTPAMTQTCWTATSRGDSVFILRQDLTVLGDIQYLVILYNPKLNCDSLLAMKNSPWEICEAKFAKMLQYHEIHAEFYFDQEIFIRRKNEK